MLHRREFPPLFCNSGQVMAGYVTGPRKEPAVKLLSIFFLWRLLGSLRYIMCIIIICGMNNEMLEIQKEAITVVVNNWGRH